LGCNQDCGFQFGVDGALAGREPSAPRRPQEVPGLQDVDGALSKNTAIWERFSLRFRAEAFNLLNHPNFTQPENNITATTYGQITATRSTRGDLGSSRQLQFGMKLIF
jgi:hypothetical protein